VPDPTVAYISQGQLYLQSAGVERVIESPFGRSLRDRAFQIYDRHAWKMRGRGGQALSRALRMPAEQQCPEFPVDITSVTSGSRPGEMFYTLETNEICGVFARDLDGVERRLFHTADYRMRHLDVHPDGAEVAISVYYRNGSANLALLSSDGSTLTEITEGESIDEGARWTPGPKRRLVFQSAGLARHARGRMSGHGPFSIQQLDLETGDMTCLAEDANFDFVWPRIAPDGDLYYIRRPSESAPQKYGPLDALKDVVTWPFQFLYLVGLFVAMATRRRAPQGAPNPNGPAKRAVPSTWQLMRRSPSSAAPEMVADRVLAYDISSDGSIIHTNGVDVYRIPAGGGGAYKLLAGGDIDHIATF
jgi:hypothetical protein